MQTLMMLNDPLAIWFLIAEGNGHGPEKIPITPPFRIGRREGFDLCLTSQTVSGLHAEILEEDGQLWLHDLNSTNGTLVNRQRIRTKTPLHENDTVQFGSCVFSVSQETAGGVGRHPMATMVDPSQVAIEETPEQKFDRLLSSGAVPFFQPIYDISGSQPQQTGFEVLGRSRMYGLRTPDQMFAAALALEQEAKLSRVLRRRGVEAAAADLPEDLMLFVNTHPAELACGDLEESLEEIRASFPNRPIVLELPESILNSPDMFADLRSALLNLGIRLAIHDFGAGQIRLSELSEMAPDIVKFDGALIQGINKATSKRQRLVAAMAKMVKELGITPMAEYIELPGEHDTLRQLGIEYAQGFHYGRPIDIAHVKLEEPKTRIEPQSKNLGGSAGDSRGRMLEELRQIDVADQDPRPLQKRAYQDADWLLEQSKNCYTIQLTMSSVESKAADFVAKQQRKGDYAIYQKRGRISEWFVVLFGMFDDRETAKAESEKLKTAGVSPWIRTIAAVHTEINAAVAEK